MTAALSVPWFAGVLDARGYIRLEDRRGIAQPRIRVTTRRVDLLEHLSRATGTKISIDGRGYEKRPCSAHCKDKHQHNTRQSAYWNCDSTRATIVLFNCLPHLVSQRSEALAVYEEGLRCYQPTRNGTASAMARLGWALPPPSITSSI